MSLVLGVLPVVLLLLGFPIFLVLLSTVVATLLLFMHTPLPVLHQILFGAINAYALLAVPFFIFTGELMGRSWSPSGWSTSSMPASAGCRVGLASRRSAPRRCSGPCRA